MTLYEQILIFFGLQGHSFQNAVDWALFVSLGISIILLILHGIYAHRKNKANPDWVTKHVVPWLIAAVLFSFSPFIFVVFGEIYAQPGLVECIKANYTAQYDFTVDGQKNGLPRTLSNLFVMNAISAKQIIQNGTQDGNNDIQ